MTPFELNGEDALGDEALDREHLDLVDLVDTLGAATPAAAPELLARLEQLVKLHFEHEEARMVQVAYYGRASHHAEHQVLLDRIAALRAQGPALDHPRAAHELGSALVHHIHEVDRVFAAFLKRPRT